jgi:hypothetical protein
MIVIISHKQTHVSGLRLLIVIVIKLDFISNINNSSTEKVLFFVNILVYKYNSFYFILNPILIPIVYSSTTVSIRYAVHQNRFFILYFLYFTYILSKVQSTGTVVSNYCTTQYFEINFSHFSGEIRESRGYISSTKVYFLCTCTSTTSSIFKVNISSFLEKNTDGGIYCIKNFLPYLIKYGILCF